MSRLGEPHRVREYSVHVCWAVWVVGAVGGLWSIKNKPPSPAHSKELLLALVGSKLVSKAYLGDLLREVKSATGTKSVFLSDWDRFGM